MSKGKYKVGDRVAVWVTDVRHHEVGVSGKIQTALVLTSRLDGEEYIFLQGQQEVSGPVILEWAVGEGCTCYNPTCDVGYWKLVTPEEETDGTT